MSKANLLDRREVVASLLADRKGSIVVGGLGASTYDIAAAGDSDRNLYLWGAMGGAVMIALGIALAQPELPVVVITGDGDMLMGMGSLATVGLQAPKNLSIVVLDNEGRYRKVLWDRRFPRALHHGRDRGLCGCSAGPIDRPALCQRQDRQRQSGTRALQPRRPVYGDADPRLAGICADLAPNPPNPRSASQQNLDNC
jgi:hypothetical protein